MAKAPPPNANNRIRGRTKLAMGYAGSHRGEKISMKFTRHKRDDLLLSTPGQIMTLILSIRMYLRRLERAKVRRKQPVRGASNQRERRPSSHRGRPSAVESIQKHVDPCRCRRRDYRLDNRVVGWTHRGPVDIATGGSAAIVSHIRERARVLSGWIAS